MCNHEIDNNDKFVVARIITIIITITIILLLILITIRLQILERKHIILYFLFRLIDILIDICAATVQWLARLATNPWARVRSRTRKAQDLTQVFILHWSINGYLGQPREDKLWKPGFHAGPMSQGKGLFHHRLKGQGDGR